MSGGYSDENVRTKLSGLNDSQDSIVGVAQWIMFHRRRADRSAELWFERLKESSAHRKLNLLYLANEIVQQSKVKNKPEFLNAFNPIIAEASEFAYRGSPANIQDKIRRVVVVWRERNIFPQQIQGDIEARLDDIDKGKGSAKGGLGGGLKFGGSSMLGGSSLLGGGGGAGGSTPLELVPIMKTHKDVADQASSVTIAVGTANTEFQKQFDPSNLPPPPVYAARLSQLLKTLDTAEAAINGAIQARKAHVRNIERLLSQAKAALDKDEKAAADLAEKRRKTGETKTDVENMILRSMEEGGDGNGNDNGIEGERSKTPENRSPEIEALTPPGQIQSDPEPPTPASELHHRHSISATDPPAPVPFHAGASELLASLTAPLAHNGVGMKRANVDEGNVFEGLDEDLVNMFKNQAAETGGGQKRQKMDVPDDDEYRP
ncbi:DUF618-domain-containing protein [Ascodesmis nigricans]|uniref:DUF618-domain-containing protein n=1 Tax=Ascodesmis nigricans TaxID=341454 RepID=A0A4S2N5N5_9PEZI|nr:DUF618-domain-containing protein [Ascodesmis nigricans]